MNRRSVLPVSSRPSAISCSAKGGEKEVRVKLTIGRKAEGSPLKRLDETKHNMQVGAFKLLYNVSVL